MSAVAQKMIFTDEDALILDRWIGDLCGEEVQFPAHRRSQFSAYIQHQREIRSGSGQTFFRGISRSGTREILALQNMLKSLHQLREREGKELDKVRKEKQSVERVLLEKTVVPAKNISLTPKVISSSPSFIPSSSGDAYGAYRPLDDITQTDSVEYEARRKLAERYMAEIEKQRLTNRDSLTDCRTRHTKLLDQDEQLRKEVYALQETERTVVERFKNTEEILENEEAALAQQEEEWEKMKQQKDQFDDLYMETIEDEELNNNNNNNITTLSELRSSLAQACSELTQVQTDISNAESTHIVRFRQTRQRLKDWQDMVEHMRRTYDQLSSRTCVINNIVKDTSERLESENDLGYMEQLRKLNNLLMERTATKLGLIREKEENKISSFDNTNLNLLPVNRPQATPSISITDETSINSTSPRRQSSISSVATTTRASSTINSPYESGSTTSPYPHRRQTKTQRRRRRGYALVTYLQRWESALTNESVTLREICEKGLSSSGNSSLSSSTSLAASIQELRNLLLAP